MLKADIYPSYLAWYFKSDAWHRYIYDNGSQGVRHDRVSMTDDLLMGIPVIFPDQAKQQEYADILDKIDARLQAAQKVYDLLIKEKCGYMAAALHIKSCCNNAFFIARKRSNSQTALLI